MEIELFFPASVSSEPVTGRIFVIVTKDSDSEPRLQCFDVPLFGRDVHAQRPGDVTVIDDSTPGYPVSSLAEIPPGDYYVQGLLNIYSEFHRADGHTIWAHMDQWEGQDLSRSPGNLISKVQRLHLDGEPASPFKLELTDVIPPVEVPEDTQWVRRLRFQSQALSKFWGHPIYIGATVLLPRDYDTEPQLRYPVVYVQGHFSMDAPFGFNTEPDAPGVTSWARRREEWEARGVNMPEPPADTGFNGAQYNVESGYEFYQAWNSDEFPRMIAVTFQHPTPYFDDSYGINSAATGPYGDAIIGELIPYVEEQFRTVRKPYARVLTGCSTGGWASLALQLYHPDFFGGAWIFCPDPVDFRRYYGGVNLYEDENAYTVSGGRGWVVPERGCFRAPSGQVRLTNRQFSKLASVIGTQDVGYGWSNYVPVSSNGYPRPVWDLATGRIDREVAAYMTEHGYDLCEYLQRNWSAIGPRVAGKLHFYCGDEDGGYFNLAIYLFEEFLKNTKDPYHPGTFTYGRPLKGHGWQPMRNAELVTMMASHIAAQTPLGSI